MFRTIVIALLCLLLQSTKLLGQCTTSPPPPDCAGTEPALIDNETLNHGNSKWYYGATTTMNSLTLKGGTLVVCGDLTVSKFYMDSGTIYVRPGARFVVGSGLGEGLVLRGNSAVYNYGTFECLRNLSLDNGYATAAEPNLIVNATPASVFKMSNQYLVINNAHSKFVNNGSSEFWGIITDPQSTPGSVCLGNGSTTRMAVMINKVANTYSVPSGTSCVNVHQYSQFYGALTNSPGLYACVGSGHTSDAGCIPWGCAPNNWGAAQLFTGCVNCGAITVLGVEFSSFDTRRLSNGSNALNWKINTSNSSGIFRILRSGDGIRYSAIDSMDITLGSSTFQFIDKNPLPGNNFYMINYFNPSTGFSIHSKMLKLFSESGDGITIYPIPFDKSINVHYAPDMLPEKIMLTDVAGRNIRIRFLINKTTRRVEVQVLDKLESDVYIIHLRTAKGNISRTILKR